jgi:hypothetical protein
MDLVLYDPAKDPLEIVFGEVKCSPKQATGALPAKHDNSCYADIFNSLNKYEEVDKTFDLAAARDQLPHIEPLDRERVKEALKPYSGGPFRYTAFAVIDTSTYTDAEAQVLRTRRNNKAFEVDIVCLETFALVGDAVFQSLASFLVRQES